MTIRRMAGWPWSWAALATNLLGAAFIGYWFRGAGNGMGVILAASALLAGVATWLLLLLRGSVDYQAHLNADTERGLRQNLEELRADLARLNNPRGSTQLSQLEDKLNAFIDVLNLRFKRDELTYQRYLQTAQDVFDAGLHNLRNLRAALESVKSIEIDTLEDRLSRLAEDDAERTTLLRRRALHKEQMAKADRLLVENEEAITALANVTTALANTDTESALDARPAIEALEALARRTSRYAG